MNIGKTIFWLASAGCMVLSGLFGVWYAKSADPVYKESYLERIGKEVSNTDLRLNKNADLKIEYRYLLCGHNEVVETENFFGEKTAEEIETEHKGVKIMEFSKNSVELIFEINDYCPSHYILKTDSGKLYVYKTSRETGKQEQYIDLNLDIGFIEESEKERLSEGIVFEKTSDINRYLWELKN